MNIIETKLPGVLILEPKVFGDQRGFFQETYNQVRYADAGINEQFVQDNHSRSFRGVLRGLHYQLIQPQGKLVSVSRGDVYDVAVDVRQGSATFGQWVGVILSDENHRQMYVPPGFAHGFCVLSETVDFIYKCTDYYHPESEKSIRFDDPAIAIDWPIALDEVELSEKDKNASLLSAMTPEDLPTL